MRSLAYSAEKEMKPIKQNTDTSHLERDKRWATTQGRADWVVVEPFVVEALPLLKNRKVKCVLDLGCGVDRHAILLTEKL
jgi:hypothetical protein